MLSFVSLLDTLSFLLTFFFSRDRSEAGDLQLDQNFFSPPIYTEQLSCPNMTNLKASQREKSHGRYWNMCFLTGCVCSQFTKSY